MFFFRQLAIFEKRFRQEPNLPPQRWPSAAALRGVHYALQPQFSPRFSICRQSSQDGQRSNCASQEIPEALPVDTYLRRFWESECHNRRAKFRFVPIAQRLPFQAPAHCAAKKKHQAPMKSEHRRAFACDRNARGWRGAARPERRRVWPCLPFRKTISQTEALGFSMKQQDQKNAGSGLSWNEASPRLTPLPRPAVG
jgi:hypothetical protein